MSCQPDLLGRPGVGFHTHVGGIAVGDLLGTIVIAAAVSGVSGQNFLGIFVVIIIIAVFLHWYFCVPTELNKLLGLA